MRAENEVLEQRVAELTSQLKAEKAQSARYLIEIASLEHQLRETRTELGEMNVELGLYEEKISTLKFETQDLRRQLQAANEVEHVPGRRLAELRTIDGSSESKTA